MSQSKYVLDLTGDKYGRWSVLEFAGLVKTMKQWAEHFKIPYVTLAWRIRTAKWDLARAFEVVL